MKGWLSYEGWATPGVVSLDPLSLTPFSFVFCFVSPLLNTLIIVMSVNVYGAFTLSETHLQACYMTVGTLIITILFYFFLI